MYLNYTKYNVVNILIHGFRPYIYLFCSSIKIPTGCRKPYLYLRFSRFPYVVTVLLPGNHWSDKGQTDFKYILNYKFRIDLIQEKTRSFTSQLSPSLTPKIIPFYNYSDFFSSRFLLDEKMKKVGSLWKKLNFISYCEYLPLLNNTHEFISYIKM